MEPIWIVDDDPSIRFVLEKALAREELATRSFSHPAEVTEALQEKAQSGNGALPQVLISDIRMPGGSGLQLLEKLHAQYPKLPIIIMTAYSDLDSAVSAFQRGAFEYLPKPFDVNKAIELIHRAIQEGEREAGAGAADAGAVMPEILGQAPAMQDVFRVIGRLSQSLVTVLVTGESGSGKELVARALHKHSPVAQGPFVAINTAAIPQDLLESELFGHERGSFTGAQTQRRGRFEQADGGTLFLDEIGDMPFDLQTRLLRVLSEGQFYRVGGHTSVKVKVRVIAATHQNLEERVAKGLFREDLFHRLNVIRVRLPALRERAEDIPLLTRYFLQKSAQQLGVEPKRISDDAVQLLSRFPFPGNVRQLENTCHWLSVMAPAQVISSHDLPPEILQAVHGKAPAGSAAQASSAGAHADGATAAALPGVAGGPVGLVAAVPSDSPDAVAQTPLGHALAERHPGAPEVDWTEGLMVETRQLLDAEPGLVWDRLSQKFESHLIRMALEHTGGRRMEAAQKLGIGRNTITRKIQELHMDDDSRSGRGRHEDEGQAGPD
ncbi:nitrogen regulation protein NR(I) [Corticibacter populi]|uniref:DNA-binding transcriptional regulator NtrC n=1 Tax=Corticibacter populi TaxID=1550736 RepID=A0A3M6QZQ8_9BURK|nr:nitrogen regulation protein NR(I) [Corticibacter populi]RMX08022.1 nitrogen regulation protein NR(I) [Corticibacter populi]RZS35266.1 two-component system nitrogen regulation response regulator GlnG [Corticibacter populi]